jgi:DNA-binding NarL/FixJ family response regulator
VPASLDWIGLLEASYALEADDAAWARGVLERAAPLFERRVAVSLVLARTRGARVEIEHADALGPAEALPWLEAVNRAAPPGSADLIYRSGPVVGSMSELVFARFPAARELFVAASGGRIRDALGVASHTGTGWVAALSAAQSEEVVPGEAERRRWPLAAAHVAAGLRLRRALAEPRVEAALDASGRVHDAEGPARQPSARAALRAAVRRIERARSAAGRRAPDAALASWHGLVSGRWSLIDRFDSDGKRFVVAVRNDPAHPDPRGLTPRQRQVAEYLGLGRSTKEIAYTLGVTPSAVSLNIGGACRRLGFATRAELAAFFSPTGVRARLAEVAVGGERLLVGSHALLDERALAALAPAEREVAALLVAGSTYADVAARRGTSARTVANQARAIFRKLGVGSRVELALRLQTPL